MRNLSTCFATCCNLLLLCVGFATSSKCVKIGDCKCVQEGTNKGIDLNRTNTTVTESTFFEKGYSVTFNPCRPVNLTSKTTETYKNESFPVLDRCNDTSLICLTVLVVERISIGTSDTLNFETDEKGEVYLTSNSNGWTTKIDLDCVNTTTTPGVPDSLELISFNKNTRTIELKLHSNSSCLVDIKLDSASSGWGTFFEVVFVVVFVYFVGGMLFKKVFFDAQGIEMLPNHLFWINVLESIAAFAEYVSGGCRTRSPYNEI